MEIISKSYLSLFFGQDAKEVCIDFLELLTWNGYHFNKVIFAVPETKNGNYKSFQKVMLDYMMFT